jgi:membrane-associated HD superfamily phosphohydrolase
MPKILVENTKLVTIKTVTRILVTTSDKTKQNHRKNIIVTKFDVLVTNLVITKTFMSCSDNLSIKKMFVLLFIHWFQLVSISVVFNNTNIRSCMYSCCMWITTYQQSIFFKSATCEGNKSLHDACTVSD